jgi:ABC-2 type transport system ATP-binding protein
MDVGCAGWPWNIDPGASIGDLGVDSGSMLEIRSIAKSFGRISAVQDLSLSIPAGTIHAFLGPNGAGKTTTIRMCVGLLRPDTGTITVDGHDVVTNGVAARAVMAYVPDEPYLYDRLTGREFLDFTSRVYAMPREIFKRRLEEATSRFSLEGFLDQLAEGYSHGMRQRVVLAAAMLHAPRLLVVDEPLVGLDPKHIRACLDFLKEVAANGGAVLMSTHTMATVEEIAHHVTVIDHGRALSSGTVAEVRGNLGLEQRFFELTEGDGASALKSPQR